MTNTDVQDRAVLHTYNQVFCTGCAQKCCCMGTKASTKPESLENESMSHATVPTKYFQCCIRIKIVFFSIFHQNLKYPL